MLVISLLIGCDSRATGPVAIGPDDACASCRMLISDHRYAAEMLDGSGTIYKFDDIACMMRFARAHGANSSSARFYVTDYASGRDWMDARQASFARLRNSSSSPMVSGLAAFRNANDAAHSMGTRPTRLLSFSDLWTNSTDNDNAAPAVSHVDRAREGSDGH
jgi:copper chaperone NosL